jgi:diguanylate cyclase (GGDEF)-like protein/PAS domain S-box-containing protein
VLGYPAGQVTKSYDSSLLHPDDVTRARRFLAEMVRRPGNTPAVELRARHRDGSWRYLEVVGNNLLDDPSVGSIVFSARDVSERKCLEEELAHRALHDSLTGLPNRVLLLDRLAHALARAGRGGQRVAVLFLDLDRFKAVNDHLGHDAGDELLAAVAQRLRGCLRTEDTAARLGGDEFVVLLASLTEASEASQVAERIVERLGTPFRVGGREVRISTSVGIALSRPAEGRPIDLLREADGAMYRAKARGAGCYAFADQDWHPSFADLPYPASAPYAVE